MVRGGGAVVGRGGPGPARRAIGVVTVARSDYGHLVPLLEALRDTPGVTLQLYVAGAHLSPRFGHTVDAIAADGWPITDRVEMIYVSPLKALSNDVQKNLDAPLAAISAT